MQQEEIAIEKEIDNLKLRTPDSIYSAMQRLQKIGEPAIEPLIKALLNSKESGIFRSRIVDTLAMIGNPKAVDSLIEMLNDSDIELRWSIVKALGKIGDERAIAPLKRLATFDSGGFSITPNLYVKIKDDAQIALQQIRARII